MSSCQAVAFTPRIDLSNLNRQFPFKKMEVKQSKAMVHATRLFLFQVPAHSAAYSYHYLHPKWQPKPPALSTHTIHANIKEPQFNIEWFQSFDIVLNALNNFSEPICLSTRLLCDVL